MTESTQNPVVTRSEEEILVTTQWRAAQRVRVSKRIVTETQTVTVRREELVFEDLPPADGSVVSASVGPVEPIEIVLHEEQLVVTRVVVPVERIRVWVEVTAGEVDVIGDVRREQIDIAERPSSASRPRDPAVAAARGDNDE